MKNTSYFYIIMTIIMVIAFFLTYFTLFILFGFIILILGIFFYTNHQNIVQLKIIDFNLFYYPKLNHGVSRHQDFFNLFFKKDFHEMDIYDIKDIEKSSSFVTGTCIYIINYSGKKTELLLNDNENQKKEIYNDLKEALNKIPRNIREEMTGVKKDTYYKETINVNNDNYDKTIIIEKTPNRITTETITKYHDVPKFKDTPLISETIIAIIFLMKKLQNNLDITELSNNIIQSQIENSEGFTEIINFINKSEIKDCIPLIEQKITKCKKEYTQKTIEYIFKTSISPTKKQFMLHPDIDQLLKRLLVFSGYDELGLDNTIANLQS